MNIHYSAVQAGETALTAPYTGMDGNAALGSTDSPASYRSEAWKQEKGPLGTLQSYACISHAAGKLIVMTVPSPNFESRFIAA